MGGHCFGCDRLGYINYLLVRLKCWIIEVVCQLQLTCLMLSLRDRVAPSTSIYRLHGDITCYTVGQSYFV